MSLYDPFDASDSDSSSPSRGNYRRNGPSHSSTGKKVPPWEIENHRKRMKLHESLQKPDPWLNMNTNNVNIRKPVNLDERPQKPAPWLNMNIKNVNHRTRMQLDESPQRSEPVSWLNMNTKNICSLPSSGPIDKAVVNAVAVGEAVLGELRRLTEIVATAQSQNSASNNYRYESIIPNQPAQSYPENIERYKDVPINKHQQNLNVFKRDYVREPSLKKEIPSLVGNTIFQPPPSFKSERSEIRKKIDERRRFLKMDRRRSLDDVRRSTNRTSERVIVNRPSGSTKSFFVPSSDIKKKIEPAKNGESSQKKIEKQVADKQELAQKNNRPLFEEFYKNQDICPEEEFKIFLRNMKKDLPAIIRIKSYPKLHATAFSIVTENMLSKCLPDEQYSEKQYLPWLSDELAIQIPNIPDYNEALKDKIAFRFWKFIDSSESLGYLFKVRVPFLLSVHLLQVKSYHKVLDVRSSACRTAHILDEMQNDSLNGAPIGVLVANHSNMKKDFPISTVGPNPCFIQTKNEVDTFPDIVVPNYDNKPSTLKFDRIIYWPSNTQDGTKRSKSVNKLIDWDIMAAYDYFKKDKLQLKRCFEMLLIGGRLVFVKESMNPIENEAVVYNALKQADGAIELVDVKSLVPGLISCPGMTEWTPYSSRDRQFYSNFEEVPKYLRDTITADVFPPFTEELEDMNFDRCIRVLPHFQNSTGFFIAVFQKLKPTPSEAKNTMPPTFTQTNQTKYKLDSDIEVEFVDTNEILWKRLLTVWKFQNVRNGIIPLLMRQFQGRKPEMYMVSKLVKDIVKNNASKLKGLNYLYPYLGPTRTLIVPKIDFMKIISTRSENTIKIAKLEEDTRKRLISVEIGVFVMELKEPIPIKVRCQKEMIGMIKINLDTNEKVHYLTLLGEDTTWFDEKFEEERLVELQNSHQSIKK